MFRTLTAHEISKFILSARDISKVNELPSYSNILRGLNPKIVDRSTQCRVTPFRAYKDNLWIFRVNCTGTTYTVTLHAENPDNNPETPFLIKMKCTCPFWKWGGVEYNAYRGNYLEGTPVSSLTYPKQRDPQLRNKLCKHAYAVLDVARNYVIFETEEMEKAREVEKRREDLEREKQRQLEERRREKNQTREERVPRGDALGRNPLEDLGIKPTRKRDRRKKERTPALGRDPFKDLGISPRRRKEVDNEDVDNQQETTPRDIEEYV